MKRSFHDVNLRAGWDRLSAARRHLYFYLLLLLTTLALLSLKGESAPADVAPVASAAP